MEKLLPNKFQKGQTLIEVLTAMGVSVAIVSAITISIITGLNNTQAAKNQNLATQYAEQGMEVVHKLRDSDWSSYSVLPGNPPSGIYCIGDNTVLTPRVGSSCGQNVVSVFVREATLVANSSDCTQATPTPPPQPTPPPVVSPTNATKVTITVSWSDSNCADRTGNPFCHQVKLESCLSDYTVIPTP